MGTEGDFVIDSERSRLNWVWVGMKRFKKGVDGSVEGPKNYVELKLGREDI